MIIVTDKKELQRAGIYAVITTAGICKYVGQSHCIAKRWRSHKHALKRNEHPNPHFQNAWNKYGERHFRFVILEFCQIHELNSLEQHWIDELRPEYNIVRLIGEPICHKCVVEDESMYTKQGETFKRPLWHLWVYGGQKQNAIR